MNLITINKPSPYDFNINDVEKNVILQDRVFVGKPRYVKRAAHYVCSYLIQEEKYNNFAIELKLGTICEKIPPQWIVNNNNANVDQKPTVKYTIIIYVT